MNKLLFGVGIYNRGKYKATLNYKRTKEYGSWYAMLQRCYCENSRSKHKSYTGCTVDDTFKNFQLFMVWAENQVGFGKGWAIDKDLLKDGNRIYGVDTCVYIPTEINGFLAFRCSKERSLPSGVHFHKHINKFKAEISVGNKNQYLGVFEKVEDAVAAYNKARKERAILLAEKYREVIDERAYKALLNYSPSSKKDFNTNG